MFHQQINKRYVDENQVSSVSAVNVYLFICLHVPLALMMREYQMLAVLHSLAALVVGVYWVAVKHSPQHAAYVGGYICGAEVLWRMTKGHVYWEYSKYAVVLIFLIALLRTRRSKFPTLPVAFFLLLVPSMILTLSYLDLNEARMQISFNLSGPLALMICILFFSEVQLQKTQLQRLLIAMLAPTVGIATLTVFNVLTSSEISFSGRSSNFAVSGGFGPNQVSAALSLGVLIASLYLISHKTSWPIKLLMFFIAALCATQSALTFSRAGVYMAGAAVLLTYVYTLRDAKARVRVLIGSVLILIVAEYVILPNLSTFTGGAVAERFENTSSSGRLDILADELSLWNQNILLGVGPGVSMYLLEDSFGQIAAAHTEYSRLLVEHGLFGLVSLLCLLAMVMLNIKRRGPVENKAMIIGITTWSLLYMSVNAMRTVAPAFLIGLASMKIYQEGIPPPTRIGRAGMLRMPRAATSRHHTQPDRTSI